ncbi:PREDICTED: endogenous retrovirus group K member 9 Gag polyprotein-like [Miniopterus natalensis]|uniref:endogenous retrovirus group K member 9 Gag polyprotein-like n=1 Tax=Miniopterus natalensis TaxID=291302 RepID=UPI0007A71925|nr:PREDICTED: endogenous retrovirus group K member 9 Gag polyprotein-like [Miniopterus natalensis]
MEQKEEAPKLEGKLEGGGNVQREGGKDSEWDAEELPPEEQAELDDAAAHYNHDDNLYPAMTNTTKEVTPEIVRQLTRLVQSLQTSEQKPTFPSAGSMLRTRGAKVSEERILKFLKLIETVCPWFPKEGTVNVKTWKKVGEKLRDWHHAHGPEKVPMDTLSLWSLVCDSLDPSHEFECKTGSMEQKEEAPKLEGKLEGGGNVQREGGKDSEWDAEELPPEEQAELDDAAAHYNHDDNLYPAMTNTTKEVTPEIVRQLTRLVQSLQTSEQKPTFPSASPASPWKRDYQDNSKLNNCNRENNLNYPCIEKQIKDTLSPLQRTLLKAQESGEEVWNSGFAVFPVSEQPNPNNHNQVQRYYTPVSFKMLKELKQATAQYGPTAPYTLTILENIATDALTPNDWRSLAKACLTGGEYLLWKSKFYDHCHEAANRNRANNIPITYEMLIGEGPHLTNDAQAIYPPEAYHTINALASKAWRTLPTPGRKSKELAKIKQGPEEPYQDFVSRLLQAVRLVPDGEARKLLVTQLAYENANSACQSAIGPWEKKGSLSDYERLCADIGASYIQGLTLAAALQGTTLQGVMEQQQRNKGKRRGNCYSCGKSGHFSKECKNRNNSNEQVKQPGLCPKCKRGKHWANMCRSKIDTDGKPLQRSGNYKRGQPRPPQTIGAMSVYPPQDCQGPNREYRTYIEPRQEAQDWTSVPPPATC